MERTNEQLKDELLRVYRYTFSVVTDRERLRDRLVRAKRDQKNAEAETVVAETEAEVAHQEAARLRSRNRELFDENGDLVMEVYLKDAAIDACLDLVGAVISDEADLDDTIAEFRAQDAIRAPLPGPAPVVMGDKGITLGAAFCLSCNGEKGFNYYICEECFEIEAEYGLGLFEELSSAWDNGARNFPRPGKNAKLIASEPRDI